jgi:hypothetical protein
MHLLLLLLLLASGTLAYYEYTALSLGPCGTLTAVRIGDIMTMRVPTAYRGLHLPAHFYPNYTSAYPRDDGDYDTFTFMLT